MAIRFLLFTLFFISFISCILFLVVLIHSLYIRFKINSMVKKIEKERQDYNDSI